MHFIHIRIGEEILVINRNKISLIFPLYTMTRKEENDQIILIDTLPEPCKFICHFSISEILVDVYYELNIS